MCTILSVGCGHSTFPRNPCHAFQHSLWRRSVPKLSHPPSCTPKVFYGKPVPRWKVPQNLCPWPENRNWNLLLGVLIGLEFLKQYQHLSLLSLGTGSFQHSSHQHFSSQSSGALLWSQVSQPARSSLAKTQTKQRLALNMARLGNGRGDWSTCDQDFRKFGQEALLKRKPQWVHPKMNITLQSRTKSQCALVNTSDKSFERPDVDSKTPK